MAERWVYVGLLPGKTLKTVAVWRRPDGSRVAWKPSSDTKGVVGYLYELATDYDDQKGEWPGTTWTGELAEDATELQLRERGRQQDRDRQAAELKASKNPEYQPMLERLTRLSEGLSHYARLALVEECQRAIMRAGLKGVGRG